MYKFYKLYIEVNWYLSFLLKEARDDHVRFHEKNRCKISTPRETEMQNIFLNRGPIFSRCSLGAPAINCQSIWRKKFQMQIHVKIHP